ncbi:MAG: amidase [Pigmentiphaga sp.]|uniref:amidase n=1 Tax=Pigmentiphaga sp. TaxID=1977564 RepID=UPI0029AC5666|nr:amidase [Pigmentiphaga sp.]MDX3906764.1 amidase [Pigmentiphaga sp.]
MHTFDLPSSPASGIAEALRRGTLSPAELARAIVDRHAEREPALRAWSWFDPLRIEQAYRSLGAADALPLLGVPVGIKDIIDVADMPTGLGLPGPAAGTAARDAACVAMLRAAGAVPVGKTVTAELAFSHPGPTRNPHAAGHTPGGSSSGSAAAVAAGMVPLALGTQTGGSVIRPAAYCGVVGVKTSLHAVPSAGVAPVADSLDCVGWFARSVEDAAAAGRALLPWTGEARPRARHWRVLRLDAEALGPLDPQARQALEDAAAALCEAGHRVVPSAMPERLQALARCHRIVMLYELARSLMPVARTRGHELSTVLREAIDTGLAIGAGQYRAALAQAASERTSFSRELEEYDFILTASAAGEAPAGLAHTGDSTFNRVWSVLGWPAVHLPTAWSRNGLPLGVQLVARHGEDELLLSYAALSHPLLDRRTRTMPGRSRPA